MKQTEELLNRLRQETRGHGAWGEPERYDPPDIQLKAATEIERLQEEVDNLNKIKSILYQEYSYASTETALYEVAAVLPACSLFGVIGAAIQDLQFYRNYYEENHRHIQTSTKILAPRG